MELQIIKTDQQYEAYLNWIDEQFDQKVQPGSAQGDKLQVMLLLVKEYEDRHYPVPMPDPVEAIKMKMKEKGLKNKDLVGKIGSKGYVSALLNKRKPLTLDLVKWFRQELGIPATVLLS